MKPKIFAGLRLRRVLVIVQDVVAVHLENQRDLAREFARTGHEQAERRREARATALDRQPAMVEGVVGRRVHREAARRAVLEALVDRQDHQASRARQAARSEQSGQIRERPRVLCSIPTEDLANPLGHRVLTSSGRRARRLVASRARRPAGFA